MGASGEDGLGLTVIWLSIGALGFLVIWLTVLVIRLRLESLVNRRVIASLQKVRPIQEEKTAWWRFIEAFPAGVWFLLALGVLMSLVLALD